MDIKVPVLFLAMLLASRLSTLGATTPANVTPPQLAGTAPLTLQGDISELMIAGVDRFLLRETEAAIPARATRWQRDATSAAAYVASIEPNRARLAEMIGVRDPRVKFDDIELVATRSRPALVGKGAGFDVYAVRWPVLAGVTGEGLLLEPTGRTPRASVVVAPDCEQSPEALAGLVDGIPRESQLARRLAESGCRVMVPTLINRGRELSVIAGGRRRSTATHREILYRAAYQMGRHLIGYETQRILAAVDWFAASAERTPIGVVGYGEGGLLALYAGALDARIQVTGVSGYFGSRQDLWREPIDRNVFGLLREFGDAEIASLILPRALVVEASAGPEFVIKPGTDAAPGRVATVPAVSVRAEVERARQLVSGSAFAERLQLVESGDGQGPFGSEPFLARLLDHLVPGTKAAASGAPPVTLVASDPAGRMARQYQELSDYSQRLVDGGPHVRAQFAAKIKRAEGLGPFVQSMDAYRHYFRDEIIGVFDRTREPLSPRTRLRFDEPEFRGYEVTLEVFPEVFFYGILLIPKDLKPGERRPVVVCQHGWNGRAEHAVTGDMTSYRNFAAELARRGFVTFAPQHLYRGDNFRTLQRKANPLKKSLFSVMTAQHEQLLAWLGGLDFVDRERVAFYGVSYGGKSALRIPALLPGYALSICSSDFSDWIWRTVSHRFESGYLAHSEYEIFEFNLGSTFNYGDLAALICPRPFMVEDFLHSGLQEEYSAAEYGRVQLLYHNLGISDRTRWTYFGEFRSGVPFTHRATFDFLHAQLRWPLRR
ncbi:MAG: Dipeptidyl aminopeptidase 4 [Verrucomicrobiota bacterium]|jgi:dienelactone hydrolase